MQDWFYITYGEKKPFDYIVENNESYKLSIPYPNNLKMPGDIIVAQMVNENSPSVNKAPVVKGPSRKIDFDSTTVFRDSPRNVLMSKVFGYAGISRGRMVVIPPVVINTDKTEARLYLPNLEHGKMPPLDDILKLITLLKLYPSLDQYQIQRNIDEAVKNQDHFVLIAKGRSMEEAYEEYVIPGISLEKSVGKIKEDGKMDYKERGAIKELFEGDVVGEYVKANPGKEGFNVFGQRVAIIKRIKGPRPGKNLFIDPENKRIMKSLINGFIEVKDNILDINETLIIPKDIDLDTGNIEFSGNIEVKGKISEGFSVTSFGSLTVHGMVEGCNLFAKNDMNLISGVISKEGFKIECHGNLDTRFIQNADVLVKKNLTVEDYIYHSHIRCNGEITVTKKTGVILGGQAIALKKIELNVAGNKSGTPTELICGVDQDLDDKIYARKKDFNRLEETKRLMLEKIKATFGMAFTRNPMAFINNLAEDQKKSAILVFEKLQKINKWLEELTVEIDKLEKTGEKYDFHPQIKIHQQKYDGVKEKIVSTGKLH